MIKRLAKCIREYLPHTILTPLTMLMEVVVETLIPLTMARLIDLGISAGEMPMILKYGVILAVMCLFSLGFGMLGGVFGARASTGFAKNLRHDMFTKVQEYSFSNIDKFSTPSIVTRLTTDVTNVQQAFQMLIRMAARGPMMLVFSMFMAFNINPKLALVFLAVVPVLGGGLFYISTHAHPIFERVFKTYDRLNNVVQENLHGVRVVKSFVREEHEIGKFKSVSGDIYRFFYKAERLIALNGPLMQFCMYTTMLLISWLGARMIIVGQGAPGAMTTGQLTSLISYSMQILMSLMMLSFVFVMITISRASAERISELLAEDSDLKNPEKPIPAVKDGSITFENVSFSYHKDAQKYALSDIDIQILSGETIGVLGGTGASKSTLVQLIPRLYDATKGRVLVGGEDVRDYDLTALRDSVAMVLQKNVLFSGTIKENLRWGNERATDEELIQACKIAQADDFIKAFPDGYDTYIEQGGANVSGGQKQRLCIARALLKKPKILILDDSTSAVDTRTDAGIRQSLNEFMPDTTKIIIAQRVASVQNADRILVLDGGMVLAFGTHEQLLKENPIYREVYESQTKGGAQDDEQ